MYVDFVQMVYLSAFQRKFNEMASQAKDIHYLIHLYDLVSKTISASVQEVLNSLAQIMNYINYICSLEYFVKT